MKKCVKRRVNVKSGTFDTYVPRPVKSGPSLFQMRTTKAQNSLHFVQSVLYFLLFAAS